MKKLNNESGYATPELLLLELAGLELCQTSSGASVENYDNDGTFTGVWN